MPRKVKEEFIEIMNSNWSKYIIPDGDFYRPATGYEGACDILSDTFEDRDMSKFVTDDDGRLVPVDYTQL